LGSAFSWGVWMGLGQRQQFKGSGSSSMQALTATYPPVFSCCCVVLCVLQVVVGDPDVDGFRVKVIDTCGLEDPEAGDTVNYMVGGGAGGGGQGCYWRLKGGVGVCGCDMGGSCSVI